MKTLSTFKQVAFAIIAMTSVALSGNLKADQPTEPLENVKLFGVVTTINSKHQLQQIQPTASSIIEQRNEGLTTLTLSQTFTNNSGEDIKGYYQLPLPNPAALIHYEVVSSHLAELDDPLQVSLEDGQSITYSVTYRLQPALLVGFHQSNDDTINDSLMETNIAQK